MKPRPVNLRRVSAPLLAAIVVFSGLAGMTFLSEEAEALPQERAPGPDDFRVITRSRIIENTGLTNLIDIQLENGAGGDGRNIYQFIVALPSGMSTSVDFDAAASHALKPYDDWVVGTTDSCNGPDMPIPAAGCFGLYFEAPDGRGLPPAGKINLKVAMTVMDTDQVEPCSYLGHGEPGPGADLQVRAVFDSLDPNPPDPARPQNLMANGGDPHYIQMVVNNPDIDLEAVEELSYIVDLDRNGKIDHAFIQMTKELDNDTIDVGQFRIGGAGVYAPLTVEVIDPVGPYGVPIDPLDLEENDACPRMSMIKLKFNEGEHFDTDAAPSVRYTRPQITKGVDPHDALAWATLGGQVVQSFTVSPANRAEAVLVSTIVRLDDNNEQDNRFIRGHFSEGVALVNDGDCSPDNAPIEGLHIREDAFWISERNPPGDQVPTFFPLASRGGVVLVENEGATGLWDHFMIRLEDGPPYHPLKWSDLQYTFTPKGVSNIVEIQPTPMLLKLVDEDETIGWPDGTEKVLCDAHGNSVYRPDGSDARPYNALAPPVILSVDGNIGFGKLTVQFNTAVNHRLGSFTPEQLRESFDVAGGRDGPTGVTHVAFKQGGDRAIVTLNKNITPKDVSGEPTSLRIRGSDFYVAHSGDPDVKGDLGWPIRVHEERMIDVTPPASMWAITRDLDGNGEVDTYEILFSEILVDTSFKEGNPGEKGVVLNVEGHIDYRRIDRGESDDDRLFIGFRPIDQGYQTHRIPILSAVRSLVDDEWRGLVRDHAVNPNTGTGNWMVNFTAGEIESFDGAPPVLTLAQSIDINNDGRLDHYRLVFSEPVKDSTFNAAHWSVGAPDMYRVTGITNHPVHDPQSNDHVLLLQFESIPERPNNPVGDTGAPPPAVQYSAPAGEGLEDLADLSAQFGGPNRLLNFGRDKVVEEDMARPVLMGVLGCIGSDLMKVVFSEGVVVRDRFDSPVRGLQAPDLFFINGGSQTSGLTGLRQDTMEHRPGDAFAFVRGTGLIEPSDVGNDRVSVREHPQAPEDDRFGMVQERLATLYGDKHEMGLELQKPGDGILYTDHAREVPLQEAEDIFPPERVEDAMVLEELVTAASAEFEWTIPEDEGCMDKGVTDYDVRFSTDPIFPDDIEAYPQVPASRLSFSWYHEVREDNITAHPEILREEWGVVEGETLRMRVVGLEPDTEYFFAIRAMDRAGNKGPASEVLSLRTNVDTTPPIPPKEFDPPAEFELTSPNYAEGVPTKPVGASKFPEFQWNAAMDPESVFINYVVALTKSSTYEPTPALDLGLGDVLNITFDEKSIAEFAARPSGLAPPQWFDPPEEWRFHVAACSGGGCTKLGFYTILVDAPINHTNMWEANRLIATEVVFREQTEEVVISWGLPERGPDVPCTAAGVQLWRRDAGETDYMHLATFGENDAAFQESRFIDPDPEGTADLTSRYLVTMMCPGQVETVWVPERQAFEGMLLEGAGRFPTTGDNARAPPTADYEGTAAAVEQAPFRPPAWAWILLGIIALLLVAGIVLFFAVRRGGETELWEEGELDETEMHGFGDEPIEDDEVTGTAVGSGAYRPPDATNEPEDGAKTHDVKCPRCSTQFQAEGTFPLKITCPNCSASGTLR